MLTQSTTANGSRKKLRAALSEGLSSWLMFEHHAGRDELLSERYLALPLAQILRARLNGKVLAEVNHPVLAQAGKSGRPPQLDFVVREGNTTLLALESKWAGTQGLSVAHVVWDCVRLELAAHYYNCDAIFVLAGTRAQVDKILASGPFNPRTSRGRPAPVLGLHGIGRSSVNVQSPMRHFGPNLHKMLATYSSIRWPRSFVCGQGTQVPKHVGGNQYTAVVWHIDPEVASKRYTFSV